MKLFRFHLSTLLLLCVFAGALLGLYLDANVWRFERHQRFDASANEAFKKEYPWLERSQHYCAADVCWRFGRTEFAVAENQTADIVISLEENHDTFRELARIHVGTPIQSIHFSPDDRYLAAVTNGGISVYRRTRDYGWRGWLFFPVFWIAAASALGLGFILLRNIVGFAKHKQAQPVSRVVNA